MLLYKELKYLLILNKLNEETQQIHHDFPLELEEVMNKLGK